MALERWTGFFREVIDLVNTGERRYGVANTNYSDYMVERLELAIQSCQAIANGLSVASSDVSSDEESVTEYKECIEQLVELLRGLLDQWKEYQLILESNSRSAAYHLPIQRTYERGRPKFDIDKEQLEYLLSLSFSWSDIAALLGISRTTLYRYGSVFYI